MQSTENQKIDLLSLDLAELTELLSELGEPRYRVMQMYEQLQKGVSPEEMTNIGKALKEKLAHVSYYYLPAIEKKLVSQIDGTVKYLFALRDGNCIESVVMKYKHGNTICISSQVGCLMGCAFCASTIGGKLRDLLPSELL
ncbi:MAG: 23S rRNA (adenine(2503)-C(2))-methyltransferase RlmN, partial [Clostridia bacterium]|nr:23S rRNA (adenine(2503)-C(2))-methyltransferase RlmN [Clostridia bacterium]